MTATIVFIRHAHADEGAYADDKKRPLSDKGRKIQKAMTEHLQQLELVPNLILCSPYLRSQQTAEIIAGIMPTDIEVQPALAADDFDEDFLTARLNPPNEDEVFFLVGHEPTLSQFAQDLVGDPCLPTGLAKSSCAVVEFKDVIQYGKGEFIAYYPPPNQGR